MEDADIGWRVKSPHFEPVERLSKNGNSNKFGRGRELKVSYIGTALSKEEAKEIAAKLNGQKSFLERLLSPARVVEDKLR